MRLTPPAVALALAFATVSSVSHGAKPAIAYDARSVLLVREGESAAAGGRFDAANDAFESALAVDPRNRDAFMAEARVAGRQGLQGKAIRLYREALSLDPNDLAALSGQGQAMVAKGAIARARENLTKLQGLCIGNCPEQRALAAAIDRGSTGPELSAQTVTPHPSATTTSKPQ